MINVEYTTIKCLVLLTLYIISGLLVNEVLDSNLESGCAFVYALILKLTRTESELTQMVKFLVIILKQNWQKMDIL